MNIPKWNTDLATKYGVTAEDISREAVAFLQGEGYMNDGIEYETLDEWCAKVFSHRVPIQSFEPFQKGDETPV